MTNTIAILGAGPAGCTLACFLIDRGYDCIVFDDHKKPKLLVGESLIPATIPILRRLGIEEKVAEISTLKKGAALRHGNGNRVDFSFQKFGRKYPDYAYNIPRPQFDKLVRERAEEKGARFINARAELEVPINVDGFELRDIQLTDASLTDAGLTRETQPNLLVDASGRSRVISRALKIPAKKGPRSGVAYFAHYKNFEADGNLQGQVVMSVLENGWSWQIPFTNSESDTLSVGVVVDKDVVKIYGSSAEERLERVIDLNPMLSQSGKKRQRVSDVMSYANYQLITEQGYGNGWILLGDAFGFVDPMLSPGVFMALQSATVLDELFFAKTMGKKPNEKDNKCLDDYCNEIYSWHRSWNNLIEYFYDGRLLSLSEMRSKKTVNSAGFSMGRIIENYIGRVLSSMVSGVKTRSKLNQTLLFHSCKHILKDDQLLMKTHSIK